MLFLGFLTLQQRHEADTIDATLSRQLPFIPFCFDQPDAERQKTVFSCLSRELKRLRKVCKD